MTGKVVLITGGAGFIGSHLAESLVQNGFQVRVLDDFSNGKMLNIKGLFNYPSFQLIRGSVTNQEIVTKATSGVDYIFHMAAQTHVDRSIVEPKQTFEVNTFGTLNILNAAMQNHTKLVVFASTSEVYGSAKQVPMDEDHPLNPASPYAASKAAADRLCFSYYYTYQLPVVIVRCFNTYGPRQNDVGYAAAIPKFMLSAIQNLPPKIYGDGKQTRDYMYVKDAVNAYRLVLKSNKKLLGKAINFGTGKEITILGLANRILKMCGNEISPVHVPARNGEVRRLCANIGLAQKELGFAPKYTLDEGLQEYIAWYREQPCAQYATCQSSKGV
jgi:UDP-glucose 4-epimerase